MHTPDEIKKALEGCSVPEDTCCAGCAFAGGDCIERLCGHALALIQQLEAQNAEQAERIRVLENQFREAVKIAQQLEAERDAAVTDIRLAFTSYVGACQTCKHGVNQVDCIEPLRCGNCGNEKCKCQSCDEYESNWQWRGVQKEDS